jgi:hypothetical protein
LTRGRYIVIKVAYDRHPSYGRSLEWIAPELRDAGLSLIEDHTAGAKPWRAWAGSVSDDTFDRFSVAWGLDAKPDEGTSDVVTNEGRLSLHSYTLDGMNWERGGESPIVYVSVLVGATAGRHGRAVDDSLPLNARS